VRNLRSEDGVGVSLARLDTNLSLIGTRNGVLDLRTGEQGWLRLLGQIPVRDKWTCLGD